jgi:hypothetical protein
MIFLRLSGTIKKYDEKMGVGPNSKKICIVSVYDLVGML